MSSLYVFSLNNIYLFSHNRTADTYGDAHDLEADQMFTVEAQSDMDQLRDSGAITRLLTVLTHANINISRGGISMDPLQILTGKQPTSSGSGDTLIQTFDLEVGGSGLPYWGAIGVAPTDEGGIFALGIRSAKLDTFPAVSLDGTAAKFVLQETTARAVAVSGSRRAARLRAYATEALWLANRPTTGTEFKTWMTT